MHEQELMKMRQDVDALLVYAGAAEERLLGMEKAGTQAMAEANHMFRHILSRMEELNTQMQGLKNRLDTIVPGG